MREIKELTRTQRNIIYWIVNSPPAGMRVMNEVQAKIRLNLFKVCSEGISFEDGKIDFSNVSEKSNLKLKETDWTVLKSCFDDPGWPTMADRAEALELKTIIMKADYIEDKNDT